MSKPPTWELNASSGVPEVWIFDVRKNIVEVYRKPVSPAGGEPRYSRRTDFRVGESLSPEAFPDLGIEIPKLGNLLK